MASRRRGNHRDTLLQSLLASEENPTEKSEPAISPPHTRSQSEQEKAKAKKLSPPRSGSQSPDPNCSICLGKLENKSFTDSCFHMFCFGCLQEWSKVKAECPLCKQPFKSIIHNVRSDEDYDQYHIQEAAAHPPAFPWESPEGYRFRYRTTVTFDRLMDAHLQEQQRQLRLLQRPTVHRTRSHWARQRHHHGVGATSEYRHRIYLNGLRVVGVTTRQTRSRKTGPAFYRSNPACTHRLVPWLNRELNALMQAQSEHVHFLMELIMDLIKRFEIDGAEFYEHLHPYLGRHTRHFIHEFESFARSPYDMVGYDESAVYEPYTETIESDEDLAFSSPGSDIIVVDEVVTTTSTAEPVRPPLNRTRKHRSRFRLRTDLHNPEPPTDEHSYHNSSKNLASTNTKCTSSSATATSGWDSPTPGPSGVFASPLEPTREGDPTAGTVLSPSRSPSQFEECPRPKESAGDNTKEDVGEKKTETNLCTSDSDNDSDSSVVILKVEKPPWERTPITLSSGTEDEGTIAIEKSNHNREASFERKDRRIKDISFSSGSKNSTSDTIDVVHSSSEKRDRKRKHKHSKGQKKKKRKQSHNSSERPSHSRRKDTKVSSNSKHSKRREARAEARSRRRTRTPEVLWESSSHSRSREFAAIDDIYGYHGMGTVGGGKFGEFFQWLRSNDFMSASSHRDRYSSDSMSRSRSRETLWPNSSRSRSPTLSASPNKKRSRREKRRRTRSRSSSIECIAFIAGDHFSDKNKKRNKKHKKHKKGKHRKVESSLHPKIVQVDSEDGQSGGVMSRPEERSQEILHVDSDTEFVELDSRDLREVVNVCAEGNASTPTSQTESPLERNISSHGDSGAVSSLQSPESTEKKFKKHPTGHKSSKSVKIKRNTNLMESLQNLVLPVLPSSLAPVQSDDAPLEPDKKVDAYKSESPGLQVPKKEHPEKENPEKESDNHVSENLLKTDSGAYDDDNVEVDVVTCGNEKVNGNCDSMLASNDENNMHKTLGSNGDGSENVSADLKADNVENVEIDVVNCGSETVDEEKCKENGTDNVMYNQRNSGKDESADNFTEDVCTNNVQNVGIDLPSVFDTLDQTSEENVPLTCQENIDSSTQEEDIDVVSIEGNVHQTECKSLESTNKPDVCKTASNEDQGVSPASPGSFNVCEQDYMGLESNASLYPVESNHVTKDSGDQGQINMSLHNDLSKDEEVSSCASQIKSSSFDQKRSSDSETQVENDHTFSSSLPTVDQSHIVGTDNDSDEIDVTSCESPVSCLPLVAEDACFTKGGGNNISDVTNNSDIEKCQLHVYDHIDVTSCKSPVNVSDSPKSVSSAKGVGNDISDVTNNSDIEKCQLHVHDNINVTSCKSPVNVSDSPKSVSSAKGGGIGTDLSDVTNNRDIEKCQLHVHDNIDVTSCKSPVNVSDSPKSVSSAKGGGIGTDLSDVTNNRDIEKCQLHAHDNIDVTSCKSPVNVSDSPKSVPSTSTSETKNCDNAEDLASSEDTSSNQDVCKNTKVSDSFLLNSNQDNLAVSVDSAEINNASRDKTDSPVSMVTDSVKACASKAVHANDITHTTEAGEGAVQSVRDVDANSDKSLTVDENTIITQSPNHCTNDAIQDEQTDLKDETHISNKATESSDEEIDVV